MISVCIIAKNEERTIARCLESLAELSAEIVVVDTGSTDATKEIAAKYTDNLYDFEWCNDFAAAKNFAISKASNDWVLVLDCDEYLISCDLNAIKNDELTKKGKVGRIIRRNYLERNGQRQEYVERVNRFFQKSLFAYEGRIHEQVVAKDGSMYDTFLIEIDTGHSGYDLPKEEREAKAKRNMELLLQEEKDPYVLYQLGKSCYMAGDYNMACEYFAEALWFDLDPRLEYVIDMVETYGYALLNSGQAEQALLLESVYEEFSSTADFHFLMGLVYMNNLRFMDAVAEFEKATTFAESRMVGVNGAMAFYNIGVIFECLERKDEAIENYRKCGAYEPAQNRLNNI